MQKDIEEKLKKLKEELVVLRKTQEELTEALSNIDCQFEGDNFLSESNGNIRTELNTTNGTIEKKERLLSLLEKMTAPNLFFIEGQAKDESRVILSINDAEPIEIILSSYEADARIGIFSTESLFGKYLIGKSAGDSYTFEVQGKVNKVVVYSVLNWVLEKQKQK